MKAQTYILGMSNRAIAALLTVAIFAQPLVAQAGVESSTGQEVTSEKVPTGDEALAKYTTNMTEAPPTDYLGNREELRKALEVMSKLGNKVLYLVGEPGTGKTAIAEQLAKMINGTMYSMEVNNTESGTNYRGQLEGRMKGIVDAFVGHPERVLFIDEFHQVMKEEKMMNVLKPAMARGQITIIAGTTHDEYRKYIEQDRALTSRGIKIEMKIPSQEEVLAKLREVRQKMETFHGVTTTDGVLVRIAAVVKRFFPLEPAYRKAQDLLDRAMVREKMNAKLGSFDDLKLRDEAERLKLEMDSMRADQSRGFEIDADRYAEISDRYAALNSELELKDAAQQLRALQAEAARLHQAGEFEKEQQIKYGEIPDLQKKYGATLQAAPTPGVITEPEFLRFLQTESGIPADVAGQEPVKAAKLVEDAINKYVKGETGIAKIIANQVLAAAGNLEEIRGPRVIVMLAGPPGNGKTEMSRAIAIGQYGTVDRLINIDVSKIKTTWDFIGAGVGHTNGDVASPIEPLRRDGVQNVHFDEFDKSRALDSSLLPILENGKIEDGQNRTVYFRESTITFAVNFAEDYALNKDKWTDAQAEEHYRMRPGTLAGKTSLEKDTLVIEQDMRNHGVDEATINRIPVKLLIRVKTLAETEGIVRQQLLDQAEYIRKTRGVVVLFDPSVEKMIARQAYDPSVGMRPLREYRRATVNALLSTVFNGKKLPRGHIINVAFAPEASGDKGQLVAKMAGSEPIKGEQILLKSLTAPETASARAIVQGQPTLKSSDNTDPNKKPGILGDPAAIDRFLEMFTETAKGKK